MNQTDKESFYNISKTGCKGTKNTL